uniref:Bm9187 n=1 Tax=Brugia malayi TaxID=6279 RepID=A0A1I9G0R2_BRUMA|nr:Bm9187 [Brugia malayi]
MEWITRLNGANVNADEVGEFMEWLRNAYDHCGHVLSSEKTFLCVCSAEFVQTFARYGFYVSRDQIMIIPSEKPRTVSDPLGYMLSSKRLFLSKCARGYSESAAIVLLLWHYYKLVRMDIRKHHVSIHEEVNYKVRRGRLLEGMATETLLYLESNVERKDLIRGVLTLS